MNKTTPRAKFIRGFLLAIGPTLVWAMALDFRHLSQSDAIVLGLGVITAVVAGGIAALLAWQEILQGGGIIARAGAQAVQQFVAGVGVLVLTDLSGNAGILYVTAIVAVAGQALVGGISALVLNYLEGTDPTPAVLPPAG